MYGVITADQKAKFAEKWGDIDLETNLVYITYQKVPLQQIVFASDPVVISSDGQTIPFSLQDSTGNSANNIQILNKALRIEYTMNSIVEGIKIDKYTGEFNITPGTALSEKTTSVTVKVYFDKGETNYKTESVNISFGAYIPKEGDIVYSDGSFSSTLSKHKTPIGFVFWAKQIGENQAEHTNQYDIRIMAFDKLNNAYPFGPSNYMPGSFDYSGLNEQAQYMITQGPGKLSGTDFKINYNSDTALNGTYTAKDGTTEKIHSSNITPGGLNINSAEEGTEGNDLISLGIMHDGSEFGLITIIGTGNDDETLEQTRCSG